MKLPIRLSKDSREPIYFQIEEQIKALIASGQLSEGMLLPSIRSLSKDLEVSMITTRRAYQNLEQQGWIRTTQGKGTFVAKMAEEVKSDIKIATVKQAFGTAIDTALRHDYSLKEALDIFQAIIEEYKRKGE